MWKNEKENVNPTLCSEISLRSINIDYRELIFEKNEERENMKEPFVGLLKNIKKYRLDICYVLCIMIVGTFLHFAYEWSGQNQLVALFGATNESVWDHLKIFFMPAFFYTLGLYYIQGDKVPNYLACQTKSILAGLCFIVLVYYTYTGILLRNIAWIDIGMFYVAALLAGYIAIKCKEKDSDKYSTRSGVVLLVLWVLFIWFSFSLPERLADFMPGLFLEG